MENAQILDSFALCARQPTAGQRWCPEVTLRRPFKLSEAGRPGVSPKPGTRFRTTSRPSGARAAASAWKEQRPPRFDRPLAREAAGRRAAAIAAPYLCWVLVVNLGWRVGVVGGVGSVRADAQPYLGPR